MALNDVRIQKRTGGLGRRNPSEDMVSGLVLHGVATAGLALNTPAPLLSLREAEALGITRAYDIAHDVLVHYHVEEFFSANPDGELYLLLAPQTVTDWQLLADKDQAYAAALLRAGKGRIRQLGIGFNPLEAYTPVLAAGLDSQLVNVISKAQALAESEFARHRPVDIVIEGRSFNGTAGAARDLRTLASENVSLVIARDYSPGSPSADPTAWATGTGVQLERHAAIGRTLGTVSAAAVNENIGWVDRFNLTGNGRWLEVGLSSGNTLDSYTESDLDTLHDKGYVFAQRHEGLAGYYYNDSHTCTELASDYAYIENNRTIHKASRLIRTALLPYLKGPIRVDGSGNIEAAQAKAIETSGFTALMQMLRDAEISAEPDVYVNPEQNILATSVLRVDFSLIPTGTARTIIGSVGFENPSA